MTVRAGIVVTGTEVLSGIIADKNGPWLSERLREHGVQLGTPWSSPIGPTTSAARWSGCAVWTS